MVNRKITLLYMSAHSMNIKTTASEKWWVDWMSIRGSFDDNNVNSTLKRYVDSISISHYDLSIRHLFDIDIVDILSMSILARYFC